MSSLENIGIALLLSVVCCFILYYITIQFKKGSLAALHYVALAIVFLLLSYQSFQLMDAWDEKIAIEDAMSGINSYAGDALDFLDEMDRHNGGNGEVGQNIRELANSPLAQKGLGLLGIDVCSDGRLSLEMSEKLKTEYNWYMFRRGCWMLGFMVIYLIIAYYIPTESKYTSRRSLRGDGYSRAERPRVSGSRRRYRK